MDTAPEPLVYTVPEAIVVARTGRTKLYEEIAEGRLRAVKRGRTTLILRKDLVAWLEGLVPARSEAA